VNFFQYEREIDKKRFIRDFQFICEKIVYPELLEVDDLDATERGEGGFGSTGTN
jgi:dUTP pyrophosphatase